MNFDFFFDTIYKQYKVNKKMNDKEFIYAAIAIGLTDRILNGVMFLKYRMENSSTTDNPITDNLTTE